MQGPNNVPLEKRFYLEVVYPIESKVDPKYFFFENTTRLGQVLDKVASAGKIENLNNQANARVGNQKGHTHLCQKLQLISLKTGEPMALNVQLKSAQLTSGDAILLEYESSKAF